MMPVLLVFLIPLAVLLLGAVVYDLRRRRRLGALNKDDISSAMDRARGDADLQLRRGFTGGTGGELAASVAVEKAVTRLP